MARVSLRRHISFWDFLTNTWPISKFYSNQVGFENTGRTNFDPQNEGKSSLTGLTNDSNSASYVKNSAILGVPNNEDEDKQDEGIEASYSDQGELTYVSESEFRMRMKSFSINIIKKNFDTILYMVYKAWIEDNVEYIILLCLFWFL